METLRRMTEGDHVGVRPPRAARRASLAAATRLAREWLAAEAMLVAAAAVYAVGLMVRIKGQVNQDGWLALLSGREIVQRGLPHHDTLTVWAHGVSWVDQQWLAQLAFYGAWVVGGFALAALLHVALTAAAFATALALARRLGASSMSILLVILPGAFLLVWDSWQLRAQSFAYPLFVAVLGLLALDSRRPSRRVLLLLPLLVLWGNLHGTVVVGVLLAELRAAALVLECVRGREPVLGWIRRAGALAVGAPLCLFVSPYGSELVGYYGRTLFNSTFGTVVTEWEPLQLSLVTLPYYVLVLAAMFLVGRYRGRLTLFESLALLVLAVLGFAALRNVVWFTLAGIALVPVVLEGALSGRTQPARDGRRNPLIAVVGLLAVCVVAAATAARPDSWFETAYPARAASVLARAAADRPRDTIFTDEHHADWLLWRYPSLRGRVALDARFELLSRKQLIALRDFRNEIGGDSRRATRGHGLLLLSRDTDKKQIRALLDEPRIRPLFDDGTVVVLARDQPS